MRSDCRITIPCARVLSKTDIFQLSVLASRLVAETCHCSENEVGTPVSVGTELQTKAFDSAEEFNKAFPPLAPVGAFCVSALYKPFGGGISVQTARTGLGSVSVFVSAPTDVTAQGLALKIRDLFVRVFSETNAKSEPLGESKKRDNANSNDEKSKQFDQSGILWGAVGAIGTIIGIIITLLIHFGVI